MLQNNILLCGLLSVNVVVLVTMDDVVVYSGGTAVIQVMIYYCQLM